MLINLGPIETSWAVAMRYKDGVTSLVFFNCSSLLAAACSLDTFLIQFRFSNMSSFWPFLNRKTVYLDSFLGFWWCWGSWYPRWIWIATMVRPRRWPKKPPIFKHSWPFCTNWWMDTTVFLVGTMGILYHIVRDDTDIWYIYIYLYMSVHNYTDVWCIIMYHMTCYDTCSYYM